MHRLDGRLADGRAIHLYGSVAFAAPLGEDPRDLAGPPAMGAMRFDPLVGDWVAVAGHRQGRTFLPRDDACPLCPSADGRQTEIPAADFEVAVFDNRFPSYADPPAGWSLDDPGAALAASADSAGHCEVVCFGPEHDLAFHELPVERIRLIVDAQADRTAELMARDHVQQVFCFENRGEEIGVTLRHPHGQVYAYPFVAPAEERRLRNCAAHRETTGEDLLESLVAMEVGDGRRVVASDDHWVAFVPFAARWPYQVQVHPRRAARSLPELDDAERDALAALQKDVLARLDRVFGMPMPYVAAWHQAPKGELADAARLYLEVTSIRRAPDRLKFLAGSEAAMGVFINDVAPEDAAAALRGAGG